MRSIKNIVILTGSGISAESGIATFRDSGGIWARYRVEDVATPEAFARNPQLVHEFYNERRRGLKGVAPNAAHLALARLEKEFSGHILLVTQNVDRLHELAGSHNVLHMHGEIMRVFCASCQQRFFWEEDLSTELVCTGCGAAGGLRPDVVWFGEIPYHLDEIQGALEACDLFISIGTSGTVYPAAGFVALVRRAGGHAVELNLEPSEGASLFNEAQHGPATEVVPAYIGRLLNDFV